MQHIESDLIKIMEDQRDPNVPPGVVDGAGRVNNAATGKSNAEEEKHNMRGAVPEDESPSIFSRSGMYFDEHP